MTNYELASLLLGSGALLVGMGSIILTCIQVHFTKKHNKATYRPTLQWRCNTTNNDGLAFTVLIRNAGLGPATITSILYYHKDKEINQNDFQDLFRSVGCSPKSLNKLHVPVVIPSGEDATIIDITTPEGHDANKLLPNMQIKVCYKSIYDEEFNLQYND